MKKFDFVGAVGEAIDHAELQVPFLGFNEKMVD